MFFSHCQTLNYSKHISFDDQNKGTCSYLEMILQPSPLINKTWMHRFRTIQFKNVPPTLNLYLCLDLIDNIYLYINRISLSCKVESKTHSLGVPTNLSIIFLAHLKKKTNIIIFITLTTYAKQCWHFTSQTGHSKHFILVIFTLLNAHVKSTTCTICIFEDNFESWKHQESPTSVTELHL